MRLTLVLMRKTAKTKKPLSYMRNMYFNNHYYLQQERPIRDMGFSETLAENGIVAEKIDDILTPTHPKKKINFNVPESVIAKEVVRDQSHPLWKDKTAYTYKSTSGFMKNYELVSAQATTNTLAVASLPKEIMDVYNSTTVSPDTEARVTKLIHSCYLGDATQTKLPRNYEVPFIGWHPVESRMAPRNQYDWKAMSWGWKGPVQYGPFNHRIILNLTRGLFKEVCKAKMTEDGGSSKGNMMTDFQLLEKSMIRQFLTRQDGKLIRFFMTYPLILTTKSPLAQYSAPQPENIQGLSPMQTSLQKPSSNPLKDVQVCQYKSDGVPDMSPLDPIASLFKDHIYDETENFPIKSAAFFSHPHVHTVFNFNDTHVAPRYKEDKERSKCLMYAYAAALGQARLTQNGKLKEPVTVNSISTNGRFYTFSTFQLNSLDLNSKANVFHYHGEPMALFDVCEIVEGETKFEGVNMDTYKMLQAVISAGQFR
eukprot:TRINITY_DN3219_c0_g1_i14.p1 TRINITY_DN3219_c0_g1~~TRINITY_DN3219_c0_g1_i14.p1  ORF type:complete len:481 (-),score=83.57 TRINITY_DN3219_c0_g1_i14:71-1513(-)